MLSQRPVLAKLSVLACLFLVLSAGAALPVSAAEHDEEDDEESDEGDTIINVELEKLGDVVTGIDELITEFQNFSKNWDKTLQNALTEAFFRPFQALGQELIRGAALALLNTPSVHPNPAVEEVHQDVLIVSIMLSTLGFVVAGILYMFGPVIGVSYSQVRMILPRLVIAVVFGAISLPLLQLGVDLSDALVAAFAPTGVHASFRELAGLSTGLVLVWVINAWLLLAFVLIFILRAVYILLVAAISPLIAIIWAVPGAKRYGDTFISGWFTALAMAPLDMLVLKFNLILMEGSGSTGLRSLSNWVLGVAGLVLLIWIPFQLYGASQAAIGQAYVVTRGIKKGVNKSRNGGNEGQYEEDDQWQDRDRNRRRRRRRDDDDDRRWRR
jgi:hypothetical protein